MTTRHGAGRYKIFVGEDNEADVYLIRQAFRQHNVDCQLEVARNGEEALKRLTDTTVPPPDLVILDLNLPRHDGLSVLRAMRQRPELANVPVVILTSSDARRDREEAAALGARRFVHKPSHLDEFLNIGPIVKEVLAGAPPANQTPPPMPATARAPLAAPPARPVPVEALKRELPPAATPAPAPALPQTRVVKSPAEASKDATPLPTRRVTPRDDVKRAERNEAALAERPSTPAHLVSSKHPHSGAKRPRTRAAAWAMPLGATALLVAAAVLGHESIGGAMLGDLKRDLETRVSAAASTLRMWIDLQRKNAGDVAMLPDVRKVATKAVAAQAASAPPPTAADLRAAMAPVTAQNPFDWFALVAPDSRVLIQSEEAAEDLATEGREADHPAEVLRSTPGFFAGTPTSANGAVAMRGVFIGAPVRDADGHAIAYLAFRLPFGQGFARLVSSVRADKTGETYVFDRHGLMLSESRFVDQFRAAGMLEPGDSSSFEISARDPGVDITAGKRPVDTSEPRPLIRSVASAVAGAKDVDLGGYRDARGVEVVGAWDWVPDVELGVTSQMNASEALRSVRNLRIGFWSVIGCLLSVAGLFAFRAARKRRADAAGSVAQAGQYTLGAKIGQGAMGTVYRASHALLHRPAAVKLLEAWDQKAVLRFEREVQLTSQLSHPSTVAIYDYGRTTEGVFYYAMEHLEGIDLADLIAVTGSIPAARVVHILRQVCGSLAEAHDKGLVHRDIKPSNIMLTVRGGEADVVKVVDFGLAKPIDADPAVKLTRDGAIFGTPGFIPPETLCDPAQFDARGDLYALGAVAYELLAGKPPFDRTSSDDLWRAHITLAPPPPSVRLGHPIPGDLEMLVLNLLAKDPARRPQTAVEVRDLLDACTQCGLWTQADARAWWDEWEKAEPDEAAAPDSTMRLAKAQGRA